MIETPNMKIWTEAWNRADAEVFKSVYSPDALIFPPNKPTIQGNELILDFMKGGLGKVDVVFEAESLVVGEELAFEFGVFKDQELDTHKVTGEGKYAVTWRLLMGVWKVQCHTWSMPAKV